MISEHNEFVESLLRSLHDEIMSSYGKTDTQETKEDHSIVTEIDKSVERQLIEGLESEFPEIGFVGEEYGSKGNSNRYWLIDPIDGTENYARGLPGATTILGLVENGEVTESYIYDVSDDVVYSAFKGKGAYANGKKIAVRQRPVDRSVIAYSSNVAVDIPRLIPAMKKAGVYYNGPIYGGGIKAVYLASGRIDGIVIARAHGGPWDYAPTRFLASEAGAVFTSFDGGGIESRSYALLTQSINDELLPIIEKALADD